MNKMICGIDEAGRGSWCGPVVIAGCILNKDYNTQFLRDSKKLSEKKRKDLYNSIINNSIYCICVIDNHIIDDINILEATKFGIKIVSNYLKPDKVLIDGNMKFNNLNVKYKSIIKGDDKIPCISAASILAKVYRDYLMIQYDKLYPEYKLSKHKGYGTKEHLELIKKYGLVDIYRFTFNPMKSMD